MFRSTEQKKFADLISAHISCPDAPLLIEGTTGLGKTRAFIAALFACDKRVAICVVTGDLITQLEKSSDLTWARALWPERSVATFRSRQYFINADGVVDRAGYEAQRVLALGADILITTASSVIYDQRLGGAYNGVTEREIILFDEADQIPQLAALASDLTIDRQTMRDWNAAEATPAACANVLLARQKIESELRAKARIILEIAGEPPVWYRRVGMTDEGGVAVRHRLPGRLLKKVANRHSTIFVSATLSIGGRFDDFRRAMGIEAQSALSEIIEPAKHGRLTFEFHCDHPVDTPEWMDNVISQIEASDPPVLVVTPSHRLAREIGDRLKDAVVREPGEKIGDALARMGNHSIFVSAAAWAGLDTPTQWKTVVVPRIPFSGPSEIFDEWTEEDDRHIGDPMMTYFDSRNIAVRRMRQVFGRGLRSPDAACAIVICDPRIDQLGDIAPHRFRGNFFEGRRIEATRTTSERNPMLRREALRFYGVKCQACGHDPLILREIEVHHLDPLADRGPGHTQMSDVAVLCRICHARAHRNGNTDVLPLSVLREVYLADSRKEKKRLMSF